MATDWAADVRKYAPTADDGVIAGIVRYCGIALQKVDSSLVSFSDPKELARVRDNFLKKKCALTQPDADLDAAIAEVGERMKADRTKNRVTVYYLLSDKFGKHDLFVKAPKAGAKAAAPVAGAAGVAALAALDGGAATAAPVAKPAPAKKAAAPKAVAAKPAAAKPVAAARVASPASAVAAAVPPPVAAVAPVPVAATATPATPVAPVAFAAAGAAGAATHLSALGKWTGESSPLGRKLNLGSKSDGSGAGLLWFAALAAAILALFWIAGTMGRHGAPATATDAPVSAAAAAPATPSAPEAIPEGAGIVSETRDEKPVTKVYFATGKADVAPAFATEAATFKSWLEAHPGSSLGVSGYNDTSGNAALNAALSKKRAQAVQAALVAGGVPATAIELVKPEAATDAKVTAAEARRVEVYVK